MDIENYEPLSADEHHELKTRILKSAESALKRKKRSRKIKRFAYAAAASVIGIVGAFMLFQNNDITSNNGYVNNRGNIDYSNTENVTILLDNGKYVQVQEEDEIDYSNNESVLKLASKNTDSQKATKKDTPVFNTLFVPYGKRTSIVLSDGTKVWVNSGSKMVYPVVFDENSREVYLEGEAIFEVVHNAHKPFRVKSKDQEIEVLGTVFNVSTYPDEEEMQTVLKSGSVQLTYYDKQKSSFKISPGTLSNYNVRTSNIDILAVDVDRYFGWKEGFLDLKNASLEHIVTRLSKYYNLEIQISDEDLRKETFSGKLDLKENIDKVIQTVQNATQVKVDHRSDKIILTK